MLDMPSHLPPETEEIYQRLLRRPLATPEMLRKMVQHYLSVISSVLTDHESHAWSTADSVGNGLLELLETCPLYQLPHVQAAVLYFVSSEDAVPDVESEEGFDDDAQVFNAVIGLLERPDLKIHF